MKISLDKDYPIETEEQITKSAEYFDKYLTRFKPEERMKIATLLDRQSNTLGVNLDYDWIINYSRITKTAAISPEMKVGFKLRKEACARHKVTLKTDGFEGNPDEVLDGLMKKAEDGNTSVEIIKDLRAFDKVAGIEYLYDTEIPDPIFTVHGCSANPKFDSVKIAGNMNQYDIVDLLKDQEKLACVRERFGDAIADEFVSNPFACIKGMGTIEKEFLTAITK